MPILWSVASFVLGKLLEQAPLYVIVIMVTMVLPYVHMDPRRSEGFQCFQRIKMALDANKIIF